ncbi:unnamed protein product [Rotaria sp. Silwood2]|nr:unnamed protein product [Rotaria sp. Silwood2]CAF4524730.1 unnamed protein product [Rotaria sp. Silwood2]
MASSNESITLIIRTTNNKYADFFLELSPLLTVHDLKQKITLNHPTKPIPKDQRLIFSGKLLDDASVLNQVFIKSTSGSSFMVHLVLDSDKNSSTPRINQSTTVRAPPVVTEQPSLSEKLNNSSHSNTYEQYLEELYTYQQQLQQFISNPNANPPICNYESQAYLQYCYTHHQMYQNLFAYQRTVVSPLTATTTTNITSTQQSTSNDTNTAPPPPPPPAQQPAAGNNNNELEQENDLLGVLNMLVELFVLCSIIYFYSTFSRFLVVFVIFALLYLHCRGYLSIHRRRRAQVPPAPVVPEQAAAAAAAANDVEQGGEDEIEAEVVANEAQNQNDIERQRPPPPPPGPVGETEVTTSRLLLTAVSTFFSSLIPERPQRA